MPPSQRQGKRLKGERLIEKGRNEASGVGLGFTLDALFVSDLGQYGEFSNPDGGRPSVSRDRC